MDESELGSESQHAEDIFKNNHDLIGIDGIIESQKHEINKKKVSSITLSLNSEYKMSITSESIKKLVLC